MFELFASALETDPTVRVTRENFGAISLLANDFWLEDLISECSAFQMAFSPEQVAALSDRMTKDNLPISIFAFVRLSGI
jgi:hypothetical protein